MQKTKKVALIGECMLELHGTAFGAMQQSYGGDTFNTAVYLSRCGGDALSVCYATALGDDPLSAELLRRWALDGFEAVRRIREWELARQGDPGNPGRRTPVVAVTANAMSGDRENCLAAGMDGYLSKPFRRDELYRTLRRWLGHVGETAGNWG